MRSALISPHSRPPPGHSGLQGTERWQSPESSLLLLSSPDRGSLVAHKTQKEGGSGNPCWPEPAPGKANCLMDRGSSGGGAATRSATTGGSCYITGPGESCPPKPSPQMCYLPQALFESEDRAETPTFSDVTLTWALICPLLSLAWGHMERHLPPHPQPQSTRSDNARTSWALILPVCPLTATSHAGIWVCETTTLKGPSVFCPSTS